MNGLVFMKDRPRCTANVDWREADCLCKGKGSATIRTANEEKALFVEGGISHLHDPGLWSSKLIRLL